MRLIDADALKETIGIRLYSGAMMEFVSVEDIAKQPTVDAVPVIRCKDCRYFGERMANGYWSCGRREGCVMTIPEGFCGWAVRRKENG